MNKKVLVGFLSVVTAIFIAVSGLHADGERRPTPPAREVTMEGKVIDLHCFMTGKFPSTDHIKCTRECIRAGVPAALETEDGLVILGKGPKGPARMLDDLALQHAEVKGKLYEREGLRYLDLTSAKAAAAPRLPEWQEEPVEEPEEPGDVDTNG
ncbi:MAG: hypothetical protein ACYSVY_20425 [Planctomycetota bacterium]